MNVTRSVLKLHLQTSPIRYQFFFSRFSNALRNPNSPSSLFNFKAKCFFSLTLPRQTQTQPFVGSVVSSTSSEDFKGHDTFFDEENVSWSSLGLSDTLPAATSICVSQLKKIKQKMAVTLYNLKFVSGLKNLDEYLLTRSYISGYQASKDDINVYSTLSLVPSHEFVNVAWWYKRNDALLRTSGVSGEGSGVIVESSLVAEEAIATPPAADTNATEAEDDDDDDVDLFQVLWNIEGVLVCLRHRHS